jgi:hypothetical protein
VHAGAHGRGDGNALDVGALGASRLRLGSPHRRTPSCSPRAPLQRTRPCRRRRAGCRPSRRGTRPHRPSRLDGGGDVHGHGADLGVRHQVARAEDLTETTDQRHHVRGSDTRSNSILPALHLLDEVFAPTTSAPAAFASPPWRLGEHGDANGTAGAVGQVDHATDHLVGMTRIDAQVERTLRWSRRTSPWRAPSPS